MGSTVMFECPAEAVWPGADWSAEEPTRRRRWSTRLCVAVVATALAGFLVGIRAADHQVVEPANVPAPHASGIDARARAEQAGIDVDATVDQLRHEITGGAGTGSLTVSDQYATATFDSDGFRVSPSSAPAAALSLSLTELSGAAVEPGPWSATTNVATRSVADSVTERVTATDGELEWDLVVGERPTTSGPLRVRADIDGMVNARQVSSVGHPAWELELRGGGTLRMDELVVVDATGAELYRALPRLDRGSVELAVPAPVLASASYPLTLDPTVSAEKAAGLYGDDLSQWFADIAWSGSVFLVAWVDANISARGNIRGTLLSATGAVLDPDGFPITTGGQDGNPSVGWNGSTFLVAFERFNSSDLDVYGARVATDGTVLDAAGIPISTGVTDHSGPSVAGDGTNFLVVFQGAGVQGARLNTNGQVLSPGVFTIAASGGSPDVAWNGSRFLVVRSTGDIIGTRVTSAGVIEDPAGIPISTATGSQATPSVASNGTDFMVAWADARTGTYRIRAARVTNAGVVPAADAAGILLFDAASDDRPVIASNGARYLVVWIDNRSGVTNDLDMWAARINNSGVLQDANSLPLDPTSSVAGLVDPAVASNGTDFLATWADVGADIDVFAGHVTNTGTLPDGGGYSVSTTPATSAQGAADIAWNGTTFLAVWQDQRSGLGDIYGARLDATGTPLGASFPIGAATDSQVTPTVASNGSDFFVAWEDLRNGGTDVYGTRVSGAGVVLDPTGIAISTVVDVQGAPSVAWNGTNYLVAWEDFRGGTNYDIYGTRVNTSGTILDFAGIAISTATPSDQVSPSVAANGSTFMVVWDDGRDSNEEIYGARVSNNGVVLNPIGIRITNNTAIQRSPDVAGNGTNFFVVWDDRRNATTDIYGRLVSTAGALVGSEIIVSNAAGNQSVPTVATNAPFLVAWTDERSGTNQDIYATRVEADGAVTDGSGTGFAISTNSLAEDNPALSKGPSDKWGVAYSRGSIFTRVSPK